MYMTKTYRPINSKTVTVRPIIARVANSIKLILKVFDTNGNEREARKLHSITLISLFLDKN